MQRRRPRQFPVSCQLCRSMKLKCSRDQPCSNCVARGVTCQRAYRGPLTPSSPAQPQSTQSSGPSNAELLTRIQRLEELILQSHSGGIPSPIDMTSRSPALSSHVSEGEGDFKWLEGVGQSVISDLSNGLSFRVSTIQQAVSGDSGLGNSPASNWRPAASLFAQYTEHVVYLHHIVHLPSVQILMDDVYRQIGLGVVLEPSHVALLLSIFSSTAVFLSSHPRSASTFGSERNAFSCAFVWSKATLDVLDHSQRSSQGSIEDVQAMIILSFVVFNFEGLTVRFRTLSSNAVTIARELSLHRLDATPAKPSLSKESFTKMEIKRRVWFHLIATDRLLALSGGPQEGTYLINPNQMRVNYPRNMDDEDLDRQEPGYSVPMLQPTAMSYSIFRLQLANLCRVTVDTLPSAFSSWIDISYDTIITLDQQFQHFLHDLPFFLRLDEASRKQSRDIDRKYPQFVFQRYIICSTAHSRRFKLNQPFFTRTSLDRRYEYSRNACLQSARAIIDMKRNLDNHDAGSIISRLAVFLHTFYLATAVLVMDFCMNKDQQDHSERRQEVASACHDLQEASKTSRLASRFLASFRTILRKYQVEILPEVSSQAVAGPEILPGSSISKLGFVDETPDTILGSAAQDAEIEGLWESFIDPDHANTADTWDSVFSMLDAQLT
ncbi:hypothetical protein P170DRAFT_445337 [Aspergillus steynii IBT 23096]|uniref:Zn(2)-C6 fungal-type domain-containing protein n=1 Tax=Aspergillus steynii IBT 23096 TaxID=1392250 RepID=A0A2I2GAJ7_9EURO|nr:uncharacterized protein P170DRAFT_445337 [Aspergillus steynii IBT 23096]PLB49897.1 hypothetical protein P170DRAFT_445337 [Aspergillus steynii IBT 23096]